MPTALIKDPATVLQYFPLHSHLSTFPPQPIYAMQAEKYVSVLEELLKARDAEIERLNHQIDGYQKLFAMMPKPDTPPPAPAAVSDPVPAPVPAPYETRQSAKRKAPSEEKDASKPPNAHPEQQGHHPEKENIPPLHQIPSMAQLEGWLAWTVLARRKFQNRNCDGRGSAFAKSFCLVNRVADYRLPGVGYGVARAIPPELHDLFLVQYEEQVIGVAEKQMSQTSQTSQTSQATEVQRTRQETVGIQPITSGFAHTAHAAHRAPALPSQVGHRHKQPVDLHDISDNEEGVIDPQGTRTNPFDNYGKSNYEKDPLWVYPGSQVGSQVPSSSA